VDELVKLSGLELMLDNEVNLDDLDDVDKVFIVLKNT